MSSSNYSPTKISDCKLTLVPYLLNTNYPARTVPTFQNHNLVTKQKYLPRSSQPNKASTNNNDNPFDHLRQLRSKRRQNPKINVSFIQKILISRCKEMLILIAERFSNLSFCQPYPNTSPPRSQYMVPYNHNNIIILLFPTQLPHNPGSNLMLKQIIIHKTQREENHSLGFGLILNIFSGPTFLLQYHPSSSQKFHHLS